jgi:hypothetical protein
MTKYYTVTIGFDGNSSHELDAGDIEDLIYSQMSGPLSEETSEDPLVCSYVEVMGIAPRSNKEK